MTSTPWPIKQGIKPRHMIFIQCCISSRILDSNLLQCMRIVHYAKDGILLQSNLTLYRQKSRRKAMKGSMKPFAYRLSFHESMLTKEKSPGIAQYWKPCPEINQQEDSHRNQRIPGMIVEFVRKIVVTHPQLL